MAILKILIDTKNLSLYGGGITYWFTPLLTAWLEHKLDAHFLLVGPPFNQNFLPRSGNWQHLSIPWPMWLPRQLRHPCYDNILFPRAVARLQPDLVMSPYHDVRMPKGVPSVITVHDLCIDELVGVYPRHIRSYYLALLRSNLRRASHVLTVSQTSKHKLRERYGIPLAQISVIYNAVPEHFASMVDMEDVRDFKSRHAFNGRFLLYSGGSEYRKNISRLLKAVSLLFEKDPDLKLFVTGSQDPRWSAALENVLLKVRDRIRFAGRLSEEDLRLAYCAADAVVYPSLCEGFGRVCLEAMEAGAPLACSDLSVMREVAGDYACLFDPYDIGSMVAAIEKALCQSRMRVVRDDRFQSETVQRSFLAAMDAVV